MKNFSCACGNPVYFENTSCMQCGRYLGFDTLTLEMLCFSSHEHAVLNETNQASFKYCKNYHDYNICNWLLPAHSESAYCRACELNELIPQVFAPQKRLWWFNLEQSKRRLIYGILKLNLPLQSRLSNASGLSFAFLEDRRMNPLVEEQIVNTGHAEGLITIYLAEADDIARESTRVAMGESYRTLLGHFRHESGHYFFDRLIKNTAFHAEFKSLFGDDALNYHEALEAYYQKPPAHEHAEGFLTEYISDYAQSHPVEDWAECWAHYFHIADTMETAKQNGLATYCPYDDDVNLCLEEWPELAIKINKLNRSLGLKDAYPFTLSESSIRKLRFVHRVIDPKHQTTQ